MKSDYKKITLANMDELENASDSIGMCLGSLMNIEPFIPLKDRIKYLKMMKYLERLMDEIDRIIIEITDADERIKLEI